MRIKCSKCGKKRDVSKFSRRIGTPRGYKSACKECRSKTEIYNNPKVTERARLKYRKSVKGIQKEKEYSTSEKHYKAVKKWAKKNTKARRAEHLALQHYPKEKPCEVCGTLKNIRRHHDDYDKPLEIRWLCQKHHKLLHESIKKQARARIS